MNKREAERKIREQQKIIAEQQRIITGLKRFEEVGRKNYETVMAKIDNPDKLFENIITLELNDRDIDIIVSGLADLLEQAEMVKPMIDDRDMDLLWKIDEFCRNVNTLKEKITSRL